MILAVSALTAFFIQNHYANILYLFRINKNNIFLSKNTSSKFSLKRRMQNIYFNTKFSFFEALWRFGSFKNLYFRDVF
jgi:hypothetical protein